VSICYCKCSIILLIIIVGPIHCAIICRANGTEYFVSGAGAMTDPLGNTPSAADLLWSGTGYSAFTVVRASNSYLKISFVHWNGTVMYSHTMTNRYRVVRGSGNETSGGTDDQDGVDDGSDEGAPGEVDEGDDVSYSPSDPPDQEPVDEPDDTTPSDDPADDTATSPEDDPADDPAEEPVGEPDGDVNDVEKRKKRNHRPFPSFRNAVNDVVPFIVPVCGIASVLTAIVIIVFVFSNRKKKLSAFADRKIISNDDNSASDATKKKRHDQKKRRGREGYQHVENCFSDDDNATDAPPAVLAEEDVLSLQERGEVGGAVSSSALSSSRSSGRDIISRALHSVAHHSIGGDRASGVVTVTSSMQRMPVAQGSKGRGTSSAVSLHSHRKVKSSV
jgi:hypothetical protein